MDKQELVRRIEFFQELDLADLLPIVEKFTEVKVERDTVVFLEGHVGDSFYYVVSGRLDVLQERNGSPVKVGERGAGEFFGFKALIMEKPRTTTLKAIESGSLLRISKADFEGILVQRPSIRTQAIRFLSRKNYFADQVAKKPVSPQVYAFFSPKGGVGTSVLAANFAYALAAKAGQSTLLIDFCLDNGDVGHFFREQRNATFADLLESPTLLDRLSEELMPTASCVALKDCKNLFVMPAPENLGAGVSLKKGLSEPFLQKVFTKLRERFR